MLYAEDSSSRVKELVQAAGPNIDASIWIGTSSGRPIVEWQSEQSLAAASSIKTAYLVELYARFADRLDESPPQLDSILVDTHPAIKHFSPTQRDEIRTGLKGITVRRLGRTMMGSDPASNLVYNAAANVATALLGGPEPLTAAIHGRSPQFINIVSRRYMLAPRNQPGDNTATAASLAHVLRAIAMNELNGIDEATTRAIRDSLLKASRRLGLAGVHQFKGGSLDSLPIVRVESGWWFPNPGSKTCFVYAVMLQQNQLAPGEKAADAGDKLAKAAGEIANFGLEATQR